jgi:sugar-specific transcriptional regulator TrmB
MCTVMEESGETDIVELCDIGRARYAEAIEQGSLRADQATDCLLKLGLLQPGSDGALVPVAPSTAATLRLGPLRRRSQQQIEAIAAVEGVYAGADQVYRSANRGGDTRLIRGADNISSVLQAAVDECRDELLTIQPGGGRPYELLERAVERELPALQRGVKQLTIYQHSIRAHGPTIEYVRRVTEAGAEIRTIDEVIDRLIIIDREVAFIPTAFPRGQEALEIRHPAIVRFLARLFENVWSRALPWDGAVTPAKPDGVVSETHQAIIRMLIGGHTQSRIARELGISARTLTTHIGKISSELGSGSPIQLGYLIATRGVLKQDFADEDDDDPTTPPFPQPSHH